jgi:predicted homoserine dehydrogenase-like protein
MALARAGWPAEQYAAKSFSESLKTGATYLTEDAESLIQADGLEVVVDATGDAISGINYALKAFENGRHLVMVNLEADVMAGPLLAKRAASAGVVYSLAYGDQPALICELTEWAQLNGFEIVCAGKGSDHVPVYKSTPDTVWKLYGFSEETVARNGYNAHMYSSFRDGTKSAIEMAVVANATGLLVQPQGLRYPPCGVDHLADVCRPVSEGGQLAFKGTVEVVSSFDRDGRPVDHDLIPGVFITFEAPSDYVKRCFIEYHLKTDSTGCYATMYRPYHLVGLELLTSILKVGLRGEPTGSPVGFMGDVAAIAKRDLTLGELLDGGGGYTVYGTLIPADRALATGTLPIGLADKLRLKNDVVAGQPLRWSDVQYDETDPVVCFRREMERMMANGLNGA